MKFILTKELGTLARWLRLFGYDSLYFNSDDLRRLFVTAFNESRIIVTKRKDIPTNTKSVRVIYVKSDLLKEEMLELKKKLKVHITNSNLFTRCADCNKKVFRIKKDSVKGLVPPYVFKTQKNFFQCPGCARIFWKATHWDRAKEFLKDIQM